MLEKQNIASSKSETLHFPNVSTLMKISLGLILFTIISTVLVYAETSDDAVVIIVKNGHLENNFQYIDNALFSSSPGSTITVTNNDVVSHMLVSGSNNSNHQSSINYDTFWFVNLILIIPKHMIIRMIQLHVILIKIIE